MSALAKPRTPLSYPRVVVRDDVIVTVKVCRACGEEKVVSDAPDSGFYPIRRYPSKPTHSLTVSWGPECKQCVRWRTRSENLDEDGRTRARAYHRATYYRGKQDPDWYALRLTDANRNRNARYARLPEAEKNALREKSRRKAAQRKIHDPGYYSEPRRKARKAARAAREREAALERNRADAATFGRINPTGVVVAGPPFARWLRTYAVKRQLELEGGGVDSLRVADELGIHVRRITAVLSGEFENVLFEVVDRALANSEIPGLTVHLDSGPVEVWDIDDLYRGAAR